MQSSSTVYSFVNATRDVTLAHRGRIAASLWLRFKGLLGTSHLAAGEGLLLQPCQSVHTFFMAYPIDVLFLDRESRVVHLCNRLRPFRISRHIFRARSAIELPAGEIERTGTRIGDLLRIETIE
ncbi:MAG: DUF192 domain-containing protein [Chloroflexi bacterium]|nr:DUF192 domain-containing protein [Chloroflexota bacterium]